MVVVYVDERERGSKVVEFLQRRGAKIIFKMLDVGDYVVSDRVGIERKSAPDFVKSLIDGRLFDQARRLVETFEKPVIIVEGRITQAAKLANVRRSSIIGAYIALSIDMGVTVINVYNEEECAEVIYRIATREQEKHGGVKSFSVKKPKIGSVEEWQLYILQCFPHVGPKIAKRILEVFGSLRNFCCNASLTELARIEGLGEKKASEILQILHAVYQGHVKKRREARTIIDYFRSCGESQQS